MASDAVADRLVSPVHITEWAPCTEADNHKHDATEMMFCISGQGKASVDGVEDDSRPDSMIAALPGQMHQIRNTGSRLLRALCVFSPHVSAADLKGRAERTVAASREGER